jgi:hypothetical protein
MLGFQYSGHICFTKIQIFSADGSLIIFTQTLSSWIYSFIVTFLDFAFCDRFLEITFVKFNILTIQSSI